MRNDILCLITGWPQKPVTDALGIDTGKRPMIACEWAVGYEGIFTEFCAFESSAWMHHIYGLRGWRNGRFYDAVIPNFFDTGRLLHPREGGLPPLHGSARRAQGRGDRRRDRQARRHEADRGGPGCHRLVEEASITAPEFTIEGDVEYVGEVGLEERAELMAQAKVLLCPTLYVEPFGGVASRP